MHQPFIIISPDRDQVAEIKAMAAAFSELKFMGVATGIEDGIELSLRYQPSFVFIEVRNRSQLYFISELMRYTLQLPNIIVVSPDSEFALEAMRYGCYDYLTMPYGAADLRKTLLRFNRTQGVAVSAFAVSSAPTEADIESPLATEEDQKKKTSLEITPSVEEEMESDSITETATDEPIADQVISFTQPIAVNYVEQAPAKLKICVKSHGDFRFVDSDEIAYLKADNNSTDIHLLTGESVTAFKTLKLFEQALPSPFVRIHNSYIVNMDAIQRIHSGNSVLYVKPDSTKIPISKSYKDQVDGIIDYFKTGRFLEI